MGFFNNIKNIKDKTLEFEAVQGMDQLQGVFDIIDDQAEKEQERDQKEREYFESLSNEEKIEYKRIKKRNENLKRLGLYGLTVAGMASGVGVPVLMAANVGRILADDDLTTNKGKQAYMLEKMNKKGKSNSKQPKPRQYYSINYDEEGRPKVSTLVDKDPYNLDERYEMLMRDVL
nr:hypothetical protein [uncultured Methanobrevibacter sp.]